MTRITLDCDRGPCEGSVTFEIPSAMLAWSADQKTAFVQYCLSRNGEVGVRFGMPPFYFSRPEVSGRWAYYEVVERLERGNGVIVRCRFLGAIGDQGVTPLRSAPVCRRSG